MTREELKKHCQKQIENCEKFGRYNENFYEEHKLILELLEQEPKTGYCKDCKWWKDNDGVYRRGIEAESQCPINRKEVFEGNGYCYMFEPLKGESE